MTRNWSTDRLIPELPDGAGELCLIPQVRRHVPGREGVKVGPRVQPCDARFRVKCLRACEGKKEKGRMINLNWT